MSQFRKFALASSVFGAAFVLTGHLAYAHVTGASWETPVGAYTADIGYDPITFTAGQYTRFDFKLWDGTTTDANGVTSGTPANFAQIWVRIIRGNDKDTQLATGIWDQPIGPTTLLYEFDEPGSYTLEVSYRDKDGSDIAVTSFPITVSPAGNGILLSYSQPIIVFLAGLIIGICGPFLFLKFSKVKKPEM